MESMNQPVPTMQDYMDIYKMTVMERIQNLPVEDKKLLQEFGQSKFSGVFNKVLGPELSGASAAALTEEQPQEQIQPRRMGLGSR